MSKNLLLEGGAAGHMAHPFDLEWVKTGEDLLSFFLEDLPAYFQEHPEPSVKVDGTNVSFKLIRKGDEEGSYEFAVDRGSMKPIDIEGITIDRIGERFAEGHGMRPAIESLLTIFNAALDSGAINQEIAMLGMDKNSQLFFNTEYVLEKKDETGKRQPINVVLYNEDFIAIHGINEFYEVKSKKKGSISRASREIKLSKERRLALQNLVSKVRRFSRDFYVYGPDDTKASLKTPNFNFDKVLSQEVTIFSSPGNPVTDTLGGWLRNPRVINPADAVIKTPMHPKGQASALSKFVYTKLLPDEGEPTSVSELLGGGDESTAYMVENERDVSVNIGMVSAATNGAIFYHATRLLGNAVKENFTTSFQNAPDAFTHEGLVLRSEQHFKTIRPIKITGEFIVTGMVGAISTVMKTDEPAQKEAEVKRSIAVMPGKFKPPHRGHMDMVEYYAKEADFVYIFISPLAVTTSNGLQIDREDSKRIWNAYIDAKNLQSKVFIGDSPYNSPVKAAYEVMAGNVPDFIPTAGDLIIPGASTKPDPSSGHPDHTRFVRFHKGIKNQIPGVKGASAEEWAFTPMGEVLSATDFRNALDAGESIAKWIPEGADEALIYNILGIEKKEDEVELPMMEINYQKESPRIKDHSRMKAKINTTGLNKETGGGQGFTSGPQERSESAPPMGEGEELEEISSMGGGAVQGYAGTRDDEDEEKPKNSLIREDDELIEHILDYLLQNAVQENQNAD